MGGRVYTSKAAELKECQWSGPNLILPEHQLAHSPAEEISLVQTSDLAVKSVLCLSAPCVGAWLESPLPSSDQLTTHEHPGKQ